MMSFSQCQLHLTYLATGPVTVCLRNDNMTEVMSMADVSTDMTHINNTKDTNDITDANDTENTINDENHEEEPCDVSMSEEVEIKSAADEAMKTSLPEKKEPKQETKTTGRTRKRERVSKTNEENINQVEKDEEEDASYDLTNMSEVALKQEVQYD